MMDHTVETLRLGDLDCWRLTIGNAELVIARQGAQVLRYRQGDEPPVVWLSEEALFHTGKSVRGGIPVCWPWFGNLQRNPQAVQAMYHGTEAPAHGLARTREWQSAGIEATENGVRMRLHLPQAEGELPGWPHPMRLTLTVDLAHDLRLTLTSHNLGQDDVTFSQALHSYLAVSDVRQVHVEGVDGLDYVETLADWETRRQQGALSFTGETDRIYLDAPEHLAIVDSAWKRRLSLHTTGSRSAVIWNPWTERARALPDMADEGWQGMLCIETANAWDYTVTLAPGQQHSLSVRFVCSAL